MIVKYIKLEDIKRSMRKADIYNSLLRYFVEQEIFEDSLLEFLKRDRSWEYVWWTVSNETNGIGGGRKTEKDKNRRKRDKDREIEERERI